MSQESDILDEDTIQDLLNLPEVQAGVETVLKSLGAATGISPQTNEFGGNHSFAVEVATPKDEKQFYYSPKLNEIFVEPNKTVTFKVKWDGTPLFVRGLLLFSEPDRLKDPVKRCIAHRSKDDPLNKRYTHLEHVLTCESETAEHEVNQTSKRCSVKVPIRYEEETKHATIMFKLMCLTSCTGGINRSLTDLVFTLEDESCQVLGRKKIAIKICKAPKRDLRHKEEECAFGKRKRRVKEGPPQTPANTNGSCEGHQTSCSVLMVRNDTVKIEPASTEDSENVIALIKKYNEEKSRERGSQAILKIRKILFSEEKL